ncbi:acetyltransferase MshD [Gordonia effusa NBRC 100432]|uniref:Mycothiol acetyltransferase n=1 Tax=Gordonia effusa NBRC 100432 TaxID=1077974 RepID=H0R4D6_9ACTN|nr:mycothiol synthase [Gordonia effusa]GAB19937.1 acetyltransferase MshD [Gordonia effusa NBRC 100432]
MTDVARLSTLTADQRHDVAQMLNAALAQDGVAALSEQAELAIAHAAPQVEHFLVTGAASGYGNVLPGRDGEASTGELVVAPEHRRNGVGTALLTAILDAYPHVRLWAHGNLDGAQALAASVGVSSQRELLQLRRALGAGSGASGPNVLGSSTTAAALPELPLREDIILRTYAGAEDDAEILRVNNAAFDWHPEQGGWSLDDIAARTGSDWFDEAGLFLAFDAEQPRRLLGFHWTKIHGPDLGEVYIVGVDPSAQGRGLGRYLTLAGLRYLEPLVAECNLYVEGDNTAALHTYQRLGFAQYAIDVAYGRA